MATKMPGAIWRPIEHNYTRSRRPRTRAVVLHVAASEAATLHGWFNNPAARASSHFYVRRDGTIEQYVDADLISWANGSGNSTTLTVETQGMGHGEWTSRQVDALARICKWANTRYGVPLRVMQDAKPSTSGIGYHRLGVPGYMKAGSEKWSSSPGKICPGPERIAQVPTVVAQARGDKSATLTPSGDWFDMATKKDLEEVVRKVVNDRVPEIVQYRTGVAVRADATADKIARFVWDRGRDIVRDVTGATARADATAEKIGRFVWERGEAQQAQAQLAANAAAIKALSEARGVDPETVETVIRDAVAGALANISRDVQED